MPGQPLANPPNGSERVIFVSAGSKVMITAMGVVQAENGIVGHGGRYPCTALVGPTDFGQDVAVMSV